MSESMAETDLIADLRRLLADDHCLCSSSHTDWQGVEALLDRLDVAEKRVSRVGSLALNCKKRANADRAAANRPGITIGEMDSLLTRAENYDVMANGILRALDVSPTTPAETGGGQ